MSRWIDADAAIARIAGQMSYEIEVETGNETDCVDIAEELLNGIPSIDIVRCKECKYYKQSEAFCENGNGLWQAGDECFCNYGEREGE